MSQRDHAIVAILSQKHGGIKSQAHLFLSPCHGALPLSPVPQKTGSGDVHPDRFAAVIHCLAKYPAFHTLPTPLLGDVYIIHKNISILVEKSEDRVRRTGPINHV